MNLTKTSINTINKEIESLYLLLLDNKSNPRKKNKHYFSWRQIKQKDGSLINIEITNGHYDGIKHLVDRNFFTIEYWCLSNLPDFKEDTIMNALNKDKALEKKIKLSLNNKKAVLDEIIQYCANFVSSE